MVVRKLKFTWVSETVDDFNIKYSEVEKLCIDGHEQAIQLSGGDRKLYAKNVLSNNKYSSVCFNMLDGKEYSHIIWETLKPKIV